DSDPPAQQVLLAKEHTLGLLPVKEVTNKPPPMCQSRRDSAPSGQGVRLLIHHLGGTRGTHRSPPDPAHRQPRPPPRPAARPPRRRADLLRARPLGLPAAAVQLADPRSPRIRCPWGGFEQSEPGFTP